MHAYIQYIQYNANTNTNTNTKTNTNTNTNTNTIHTYIHCNIYLHVYKCVCVTCVQFDQVRFLIKYADNVHELDEYAADYATFLNLSCTCASVSRPLRVSLSLNPERHAMIWAALLADDWYGHIWTIAFKGRAIAGQSFPFFVGTVNGNMDEKRLTTKKQVRRVSKKQPWLRCKIPTFDVPGPVSLDRSNAWGDVVTYSQPMI